MKKNKNIWIIGSIASVILFAIIFIQLKCTKFVYYWDYVGYYENCLSVIWHFGQSFTLGIKKVIYTIFYDEYNYLAAILPSIPMAIFGKNRIVYTLGITVMYYIPFIFLYLIFVNRFLKDIKYKNIWLAISLIPCMPFLLYLNYMGYVDIGGLNLAILIYLLVKRKKNEKLNYVLVGSLLMLMFFFRRWYMFYILAFLITLFIFDLYDFIKNKENIERKKLFLEYLKKYLIIGGTMVGIVIITFLLNAILFKNDTTFKIDWSNFYLIKLLFVNYGELYSAYSRPLSSDLLAIGTRFGYIIMILSIFSIIISIKNKKNIKQILFLTVQTILCFVLFEKTQSHDIHHFLLYVVNIMLIITYIFSTSSKLYTKITVSVILLLNLICSIPLLYTNPVVKALKKCYIVNSINLEALRRDDLEEFDEIDKEIENLSENGTKKIYINASSNIINDSMIYSYDKTIGRNYDTKSYILEVSHVDSRDGLPKSIKDADIIMVTDPDQKHMVDQNQKVISYINDIFLNEDDRNSFSNNYELKEQMKINNVNVYFYKKIDDISDDEYNEFIENGERYIENYKLN